MKVTAIIGSRKTGNTNEITRFFIDSLQSLFPDMESELLYLSENPFPYCTGCHNCILRGEQFCPHSEITAFWENKIKDADAVILASPGYMFSVTGIMKSFLDHVAYNCHRPKYFEKPFFLLSAATKWQAKSVFAPMETWASGSGGTIGGKEYIELMPFPMAEKQLETKRKKLRKGAAQFAKAIRMKDKLNPQMGDLMIFRAFRTLSNLFPQVLKADKAYYEKIGAYEKTSLWYKDVPISPIKLLIASFAERAMVKEMAGMADFDKLEDDPESSQNIL